MFIWRDSVCAGDDCAAPHEITIPAADESLRSLTARLIAARYLASIAGGHATWILRAGSEAGRALAVLAQQWSEARFLVQGDAPASAYIPLDATPHLYVQYWCQVSPDSVFDALSRGEPLPDRYGR
jgi:hypothetical protein